RRAPRPRAALPEPRDAGLRGDRAAGRLGRARGDHPLRAPYLRAVCRVTASVTTLRTFQNLLVLGRAERFGDATEGRELSVRPPRGFLKLASPGPGCCVGSQSAGAARCGSCQEPVEESAPQPVTEAAKFGGHRNGELGGSLPTAVSRTVSWFS